MANDDKVNEIFGRCKEVASVAADKATVMIDSASANVSASIKEMREESAASSRTDDGNYARDGDARAAAEAGECVLSGELAVSGAADDAAGIPVKHSAGEVVKGCVHKRIEGFKSGLHNKKLLITAGIMALVWLALTILPALGFNPAPVQSLSFLTFARGGLSGGVPGLIGGLIGKGLIAYFVTLLIVGGISGESIVSNVRSLAAQFSGGKWDLAAISPLLVGGGAALFVYNFLAGTSTIMNCMVGVVAFLIAARALANRAGCVRQVFAAVFAREGRADSGLVTKVMAGWAGGFALGVVLSVFGGYICYIAGFVLLAVGAVLMVTVQKQAGGVPA
ncbi:MULTISPECIES: hypothetical protein [Methanoculleus]|uniref:Uncharacterized protein n=2 Tax=Methanoculleus TaxID=45989 RepID=A3CXD3_METMJ|nr:MULTISPECIES: hypothetical protein [Methanoculleus]ABN58033.1 hypothetical protein Memar_2108 [Methanoculleus marisnigri JR1]MCC7554698.1 hypothetical protein [Methanoculleus marisnigri]UYU19417.1 hypothetical protein OH143_04825 [Methanoculleus submarinus]